MKNRDEQMMAFSEAVGQGFKDRIGVNLHTFFPERTALASSHKVEEQSS